MNNGRDCEHGRRVGSCDSCELVELEIKHENTLLELDIAWRQIERLEQEILAIKADGLLFERIGKQEIFKLKKDTALNAYKKGYKAGFDAGCCPQSAYAAAFMAQEYVNSEIKREIK